MGKAERPLVQLGPPETSLADGTTQRQPGQTPGVDMSVPGETAAKDARARIIEKLTKRIKVLKEEARTKSDYAKVKRMIEKHGGKWKAPNGLTYGVTKEGWIYQYLTEDKSGVAQTTIVALDADPPFIAVIHTDLQFAKDPAALLKELEGMAKRRKKPPPPKPPAKPATPPEIIVIVDKDWLSKICETRWGHHDWTKHLTPTQLTLDARAKAGDTFHEDWIYPGDTFEVIGSEIIGKGPP